VTPLTPAQLQIEIDARNTAEAKTLASTTAAEHEETTYSYAAGAETRPPTDTSPVFPAAAGGHPATTYSYAAGAEPTPPPVSSPVPPAQPPFSGECDCGWTKASACPTWTQAGSNGWAVDDGSYCYRVCCSRALLEELEVSCEQ